MEIIGGLGAWLQSNHFEQLRRKKDLTLCLCTETIWPTCLGIDRGLQWAGMKMSAVIKQKGSRKKKKKLKLKSKWLWYAILVLAQESKQHLWTGDGVQGQGVEMKESHWESQPVTVTPNQAQGLRLSSPPPLVRYQSKVPRINCICILSSTLKRNNEKNCMFCRVMLLWDSPFISLSRG